MFPLPDKSGKKLRVYGAAGRGRTVTVSLPPDFESGASANSTTAACVKNASMVPMAGVEPAREITPTGF